MRSAISPVICAFSLQPAIFIIVALAHLKNIFNREDNIVARCLTSILPIGKGDNPVCEDKNASSVGQVVRIVLAVIHAPANFFLNTPPDVEVVLLTIELLTKVQEVI